MLWDWEEGGFTSHAGGAPLSQYRFINLPKTDDNDRTHKNDANNHLDIWSMLLSGQVPHSIQAIQITYFEILKILC